MDSPETSSALGASFAASTPQSWAGNIPEDMCTPILGLEMFSTPSTSSPETLLTPFTPSNSFSKSPVPPLLGNSPLLDSLIMGGPTQKNLELGLQTRQAYAQVLQENSILKARIHQLELQQVELAATAKTYRDAYNVLATSHPELQDAGSSRPTIAPKLYHERNPHRHKHIRFWTAQDYRPYAYGGEHHNEGFSASHVPVYLECRDGTTLSAVEALDHIRTALWPIFDGLEDCHLQWKLHEFGKRAFPGKVRDRAAEGVKKGNTRKRAHADYHTASPSKRMKAQCNTSNHGIPDHRDLIPMTPAPLSCPPSPVIRPNSNLVHVAPVAGPSQSGAASSIPPSSTSHPASADTVDATNVTATVAATVTASTVAYSSNAPAKLPFDSPLLPVPLDTIAHTTSATRSPNSHTPGSGPVYTRTSASIMGPPNTAREGEVSFDTGITVGREYLANPLAATPMSPLNTERQGMRGETASRSDSNAGSPVLGSSFSSEAGVGCSRASAGDDDGDSSGLSASVRARLPTPQDKRPAQSVGASSEAAAKSSEPCASATDMSPSNDEPNGECHPEAIDVFPVGNPLARFKDASALELPNLLTGIKTAVGPSATLAHDSNTQTTPVPKKGRKQQVTKSRTARNLFAYIHMTIERHNTLNKDFTRIYEGLPAAEHQKYNAMHKFAGERPPEETLPAIINAYEVLSPEAQAVYMTGAPTAATNAKGKAKAK